MRSEARGSPPRPTAGAAEAVLPERAAVSDRHLEAAFVEVGRVALQVGPADATAALTVVQERRARRVWSSDRSAARLDAVQYNTHGAPSPEVAAGSGWEAVPIGDLIDARACPALTVEAGKGGVESLLSVSLAFYAPMLVLPRRGTRASYGSLTLYAARPDAFTRTVVNTVLAVTRHVAFGLTAKARIEVAEQSREALSEQLRDGLESRSVIGRAQGILMERYQISAEKAYALLHRASMSRHRKVRDLAEEVVGSTEGRQIVSDVFEQEDLGSAYSRLSQMGLTPQDLAVAGGDSGHRTPVDAGPSELQVPSA